MSIRVRIHKNRNVELTGIHCSDFKSLLTMAVLHAQEELAKPETDVFMRGHLKIMMDILGQIETSYRSEHRRVIVPARVSP
jgi:hypothetical protein